QSMPHDLVQQEKRQAPFAAIPLWSDTAGPAAATGRSAEWGEPAAVPAAVPAAPAMPAIAERDDRLLRAKQDVRSAPEASAEAKPAPAMEPADKDEFAAAAKARKSAESPAPPAATAPAPAVATGGIGEGNRPAAAPSAGQEPQRTVEQPAAPTAIGKLQVIVIHLPDGGAACPPPEIGAAIEIVLPADRPAAN
ncbi:MAG TPA: hypothetical protein VMF29_04000, partial [Candidatus Edwardsbacteria bacterium]|nr:hypothetical protein [Candidatus Edwardsbacteria bacterium]